MIATTIFQSTGSATKTRNMLGSGRKYPDVQYACEVFEVKPSGPARKSFMLNVFAVWFAPRALSGENVSSETHGEDCLTSIMARNLPPVDPVRGFSSVVKRNPLSYLRMVA